jgi:capsular polysaccharide biosynthesis protein
MNNLTANEEYIDLGEIISALFRRIGLIMLITVLCGAAGFIYARFVATPLYSASAMMIVNSGQRSQDYVSTDQLRSAASLVDTYSIIVRSDTVMDKVIQRLKMEDTFDDIVKNISVSAVDETQIMRITITATDPQSAVNICTEITKVAPDALVDMVEAGSVRLVSAASSTFKPVSPNIPRTTILAAFLGFALTAALIIIRALLDNKVKTEADITAINLPVLGVIPMYETEDE